MAGSEELELAWLREHADTLLAALDDAGALHFRGFTAPTTKPGFRRFCEALPFSPCADPLASIGVRSLLSQADGVYEAVNAQALAATTIGLHNDATWKLTAPFAAFVCFEPADSGGAFLVADGRRVLADLEPGLVEKLSARNISVRVAALDAAPLLRLCPAPLLAPLRAAFAGAARVALDAAVPLGLVVAWGGAEGHTLQVLERPKPPLNAHPASGAPTWFSSLHSQSSHLQQRRAEGEPGFSMTEAFYGDLTPIEPAELEQIDEVITRHVRRVQMRPGEVVLLDSYQVLHGRDPFHGTREHGVLWLTSDAFAPPGAEEEGDGEGEGDAASAFSRAVNWLAVKRTRT